MPYFRQILTVVVVLLAVEGVVALWVFADRNNWSLPGLVSTAYAQGDEDEIGPPGQSRSPGEPTSPGGQPKSRLTPPPLPVPRRPLPVPRRPQRTRGSSLGPVDLLMDQCLCCPKVAARRSIRSSAGTPASAKSPNLVRLIWRSRFPAMSWECWADYRPFRGTCLSSSNTMRAARHATEEAGCW